MTPGPRPPEGLDQGSQEGHEEVSPSAPFRRRFEPTPNAVYAASSKSSGDPDMARPGQNHRRAFTLIEMIVVVSIIAILLALLLPSLSGARRNSKSTQSRSNLRQLHVGMTSFTNANKERFMSPNTELEFTSEGIDVKCKAWINASPENRVNDPDGLHAERETERALEEGWAFEYCGGGDVFVSPLDITGRLRSYSMNGILSEDPDPYYTSRFISPYNPDGPPQPPAPTLTNIAFPDQMMHFLPEDFDPRPDEGLGKGGWNVHGFLINPLDSIWTDIPAFFLEDGINLAYIDGHVEFEQFKNPEVPLAKNLRDYRQDLDGPDYQFFRSIFMPGMEQRMGIPEPEPDP